MQFCQVPFRFPYRACAILSTLCGLSIKLLILKLNIRVYLLFGQNLIIKNGLLKQKASSQNCKANLPDMALNVPLF